MGAQSGTLQGESKRFLRQSRGQETPKSPTVLQYVQGKNPRGEGSATCETRKRLEGKTLPSRDRLRRAAKRKKTKTPPEDERNPTTVKERLNSRKTRDLKTGENLSKPTHGSVGGEEGVNRREDYSPKGSTTLQNKKMGRVRDDTTTGGNPTTSTAQGVSSAIT